eukprot:scaffold87567_cov43-Attheya_sp.AAC.2
MLTWQMKWLLTWQMKYWKKERKAKRRSGAKKSTSTRTVVPRQPKFEGHCKEIKSHTYDCSDARQLDIFAKTTKEVAGYVGREYRYGADAGYMGKRGE